MRENTQESLSDSYPVAQPGDVRGLPVPERDALIISATQVNGQWVILSRYSDDTWQLDGFSSNMPANKKRLDFRTVSQAFRVVMKAILYRYLQRGLHGAGRPKGAWVRSTFDNAKPLLRHLESLQIDHLGAVTPLVCATYVNSCKAHRQPRRSKGKPLAQSGLLSRFKAVEALYELSQYTDDPMPQHPWPDTSAKAMAGLTVNGAFHQQGGKTPLIPDDVFCALFERAYQQVERGQQLLNLRDALDAVKAQRKGSVFKTSRVKSRQLRTLGWDSGARAFNKALTDLRTACYIILASTSGCRNHELANVQSGTHHRTQMMKALFTTGCAHGQTRPIPVSMTG